MRFSSLSEWLKWQEGLHPSTIELGLERVSEVFKRLHDKAPPCPVVTVAGTNGKGSTVAILESIYQKAGYRTAAYTSPHLLRYNERIHLNGNEVSDEAICQAFEHIDQARLPGNQNEISLTYFEFGTLAALDIFYRAEPDVILLEVGLGGRLDAVNIIDADIAIITSIGIDHTAWLGYDRETIAREKAGIMRKGKPVIFSSPDMPGMIEEQANNTGATLYRNGVEFSWKHGTGFACWDWEQVASRKGDLPGEKKQRVALPMMILRGEHQLDNAAGALMAIECLQDRLSVNQQQIKSGLLEVKVPGRFQAIPGESGDKPLRILDVAHNTDSISRLADILRLQESGGENRAVLGMLDDKSHLEALKPMLPLISEWYLVDLGVPRGVKGEYLENILKQLDPTVKSGAYPSVKSAIEVAENVSQAGDRLVIFGSFYTVEFAMQLGI